MSRYGADFRYLSVKSNQHQEEIMTCSTVKGIAGTAAIAALVLACGGDGGPAGPSVPVLASAEAQPSVITLYNSAPGNAVLLATYGKDPGGALILSGVTKSFATDNAAVATVSGDGTITAVSVGSARITSTLKVGDVTR